MIKQLFQRWLGIQELSDTVAILRHHDRFDSYAPGEVVKPTVLELPTERAEKMSPETLEQIVPRSFAQRVDSLTPFFEEAEATMLANASALEDRLVKGWQHDGQS